MTDIRVKSSCIKGEVVGLHFTNKWHSRYLNCDMYTFGLSLRAEDGEIYGGDFHRRYQKSVEELNFKLGDVIECEYDYGKMLLKPMITK